MEKLITIKCAIAPPTEVDAQKVEKAWQLYLPTNSPLRCLLIRMINTKPEERPSIREVLGDAYFGNVPVSNDTFEPCNQKPNEVNGIPQRHKS